MIKNIEKYSRILKIGIPIALENVILSIINFIDVFMVGRNLPEIGLGVSAISAVGIVSQIFFIYLISLFGILSGVNIFASQFFGLKDYKKLREIGTLVILFIFITSLLIVIFLKFYGVDIISLYTNNVEVINLAKKYLNVILIAIPIVGITFCIEMQLRAINQPKYSLYANFIGLIINIFLNYILIFGKFGFPALGVVGAAIATVVARLITLIYLFKKVISLNLPVINYSIKLKDIKLDFPKKLILDLLKVSIPTFINDALWVLAITIRMGLYSRMGVSKFAALQITFTISNLLFSFYIGLENASAVVVGNYLGANDKKNALVAAKQCINLTILLSFCTILIINSSIRPILYFMEVEKELIYSVVILIFIDSIISVIKAFNFLIIVGFLRAGGDILFSVLVDLLPLWFISLPLVYICYKYFNLPIYTVYAISSMAEIIQMIPCIIRYKSRKWLNSLVK